MHKLILIQNDYPATGKSTLARCCSRYLRQHGAAHQRLALVEEAAEGQADAVLEAASLSRQALLGLLTQSPVTVLEVATGLGEFFVKFYQNHGLAGDFDRIGVQLTVMLPVTSESDSFDAVLEAAEVFSDRAEYAIAHLVTSSYEDDDKVWDSSYAARVMDMFETVELCIPEVGAHLDQTLQACHVGLNEALLDPALTERLGREYGKWLARVLGQIDGARQHLFGDAFQPTVAAPAAGKVRARARAA